ncbi:MAG TPA: ABC transporter ATP-binding protein [Gammaproteobacteria bacterium]|nr:ABC transporter ATP-binding protein [Gammaproteobacteria bacterium]
MLYLEDVHCRRGLQAQGFSVRIPSLSVERGEVIALTGPSGCGKSTVLEILGLVLRPDGAGAFAWREGGDSRPLDLAALWGAGSDRQLSGLRAERIGFVLQTGGLLPYLTVRRNIFLVRRLLGLSLQSTLVDELVEALGIGHLLGRKPHQLSIGERQRASIARALAHEPALFLADEPTSALDPKLAGEVFELMMSAVEKTGSAAVIVSHDHDRVRACGLREIRAQSGDACSVFEGLA